MAMWIGGKASWEGREIEVKFDGIFKLVTRDLFVRGIKRAGAGPYGQV